MATLSTSAYSEQPENVAASREQLILDHLPQVNWIATRIHEKLPGNTNLEDLISIGIIGLINAIDNFDASFNVKLKTYAEYKIRGAILDSVRGMDGIAPHKRKRLKAGADGLDTLEQRLQRAPSEEEIAAEMGLPHAGVSGVAGWSLRGISIGSLDAPLKRRRFAKSGELYRRSTRRLAGPAAGTSGIAETDSGRVGEAAGSGAAGARPVLPAGPKHSRDRAHSGPAHYTHFADQGASGSPPAQLHRATLADAAGSLLT